MFFQPIGVMETCFQEKFGVPRQSGMVPAAWGRIRLLPDFPPESVLHLSGFSHLWVLYVFHKGKNENHPRSWSPTIEPPRIEAPRRVGVFASRSPHRPNPIGMSVVRIEAIRTGAGDGVPGGVEIDVSGVDILDGSPVLDLKPYLPYADSLPGAASGWVEGDIARAVVFFTPEVEAMLRKDSMEELARQILEWDPRPRSQRAQAPLLDPASAGRVFAFRLGKWDLHWRIRTGGGIEVFRILPLGTES